MEETDRKKAKDMVENGEKPQAPVEFSSCLLGLLFEGTFTVQVSQALDLLNPLPFSLSWHSRSFLCLLCPETGFRDLRSFALYLGIGEEEPALICPGSRILIVVMYTFLICVW